VRRGSIPLRAQRVNPHPSLLVADFFPHRTISSNTSTSSLLHTQTMNATISLGAYNSGTHGKSFCGRRCFRSRLHNEESVQSCRGDGHVTTALKIERRGEVKLFYMCGTCSPWTGLSISIDESSGERGELISYADQEFKEHLPCFEHGGTHANDCCFSSTCNVSVVNRVAISSIWQAMTGAPVGMCHSCTKQNHDLSYILVEQSGEDQLPGSSSSENNELKFAADLRRLLSEVAKFEYAIEANPVDEAACVYFDVVIDDTDSLSCTAIDEMTRGSLGNIENLLDKLETPSKRTTEAAVESVSKKPKYNEDNNTQESNPGYDGSTSNATSQIIQIDGNAYKGEVHEGVPHGTGTMFYNNQMAFTGQWEAGERIQGQGGKWQPIADLCEAYEIQNKQLRQELARVKSNWNSTNELAALSTHQTNTNSGDSNRIAGPPGAGPNPLELTRNDEHLTIPAGSLIQYAFTNPDSETELTDFAIINNDAQGNIVLENRRGRLTEGTDGVGPQVLSYKPLAICVLDADGVGGYRAYNAHNREGPLNVWYQANNVTVTGSIRKSDVSHLYRIICDSEMFWQLNEEIRLKFWNYFQFKSSGQTDFCLSDIYQMRHPNETPARILDTTDDGRFWLRHLLPDITYFRPITVSKTNVFVVTAAYDIVDWVRVRVNDINHKDVDNGFEKICCIKNFIDATRDPLMASPIRLPSLMAYSVALIRLFASVSWHEPIMKTLNCIFCSKDENNKIQVPVGLQTFVLPVRIRDPRYGNIELNSILPISKIKNSNDLYKDKKDKILVAAAGTGNLQVGQFLSGRSQVLTQIETIPQKETIRGATSAMLGLSAAIYLYLSNSERTFISVIDYLADLPLNQKPPPDLKKACDSCCKNQSILNRIFGGGKEHLQYHVDIVIKFAVILRELRSLSTPDGFKKAFEWAISNSNIFDDESRIENAVLESNTALDADTAQRCATLLSRLREWGEKVEKVESARILLNTPSVSLYAAIKQLGPIERFFYGPLASIAIFEEPNVKVDVRNMIDGLNLRPCVAVNPAISQDVLQMVRQTLFDCGLYTSDFDPFVMVNMHEPVRLSDEVSSVFLNFFAAYGLQTPSFQSSAAQTLFAQVA